MINSGSLIKSAGYIYLIMNLNNSGMIDIQSGALAVNGNYTQIAGSLRGVNAITVNGLTSLSGGSPDCAGANLTRTAASISPTLSHKPTERHRRFDGWRRGALRWWQRRL